MLKWDALFFIGDWIPQQADVRALHPRLTVLRRRYLTVSELLYKAQRSAFCIYGSYFRNPATEEAAAIARAGCPVLIDPKYQAECPFGIPVVSPAPRIPGDVFSDRVAIQAAISQALSIGRDEIRRRVPGMPASYDSIYALTPQVGENGAAPIDWDRDWDEAMLWNDRKPSAARVND